MRLADRRLVPGQSRSQESRLELDVAAEGMAFLPDPVGQDYPPRLEFEAVLDFSVDISPFVRKKQVRSLSLVHVDLPRLH